MGKININSVVIPNFGWPLTTSSESIKSWVNPEQTISLSINYFSLEPDIPTLKNIDQLRDFFRKALAAQGYGMVELDILQTFGISMVKGIFKIPQRPFGMTYLASMTIPFENCSFVIKVQAMESGATGMRDTVISQKLLTNNEISIGPNGFEGWFYDPYDENIKDGLRMNRSEEEQYDSQFPEHPLSRSREILRDVLNKIDFDSALENIPKFSK